MLLKQSYQGVGLVFSLLVICYVASLKRETFRDSDQPASSESVTKKRADKAGGSHSEASLIQPGLSLQSHVSAGESLTAAVLILLYGKNILGCLSFFETNHNHNHNHHYLDR